jgi:hypothetical protein
MGAIKANSSSAAPPERRFRRNSPLQPLLVCMIYSLGQVASGRTPELRERQINCAFNNLI